LIDATAAVVGLIVISPILLAVAVLAKLDSPGPVLHRAQRTGKDGSRSASIGSAVWWRAPTGTAPQSRQQAIAAARA
jgi:hypothetical protein